MGKIRNRIYWEWLQIRGNAKWQVIWSFIEPHWKWLLGAVASMTGTAIAYFWEWITELHPLVIFFILFCIYVLGWGLIGIVVYILRGREQVLVTTPSTPAALPPPALREQIRWDLKPHFTRGFDLLTFYKSPENRDEEAWQEWVQEVTTFLRTRLSESHVDRWNSRDGIDTPPSLPVEVPGRNQKIYADVSFRLERLAKFDRELKR